MLLFIYYKLINLFIFCIYINLFILLIELKINNTFHSTKPQYFSPLKKKKKEKIHL